jgi:DNA-binding GntR family transcriptional regulator
VKITVDEDSSRFAYEQVADALREAIEAGEIGPRVPSILQLTEDYGLSRVTVVRALGVLRAEGLIFTRPGRGNFVTGQAGKP